MNQPSSLDSGKITTLRIVKGDTSSYTYICFALETCYTLNKDYGSAGACKKVGSAEQCQFRCQETKTCTRFTFASKDGNCCMKSTLTEKMVDATGVTAGPKFCDFGKNIITLCVRSWCMRYFYHLSFFRSFITTYTYKPTTINRFLKTVRFPLTLETNFLRLRGLPKGKAWYRYWTYFNAWERELDGNNCVIAG